jgi:two-component system, sensor histidine kinase LadS
MLKFLLTVPICFWLNHSTAQNNIQYFRDIDKKFSDKEISKIPFEKFERSDINFGKDVANHWFQITTQNPSNIEKKYYLEIKSPWLDSVKFYNSDQQIITKLSWKTPLEKRKYPHQNFILPLTLKPGEQLIIYTCFSQKVMLINGDIHVWNETDFYNEKIRSSSVFGTFTGLVIPIILFSFFMFLFTKDLTFLYYTLFVFFELLFIHAVVGNYLPYYQQENGLFDGSGFKEWTVWLAQFSYLFFVKKFTLGDYKLTGTIKIIWRITIILMLSIFLQKELISYYVTNFNHVPNALLMFTSFSFFSSIITSFIIVFTALKNRTNPVGTRLYLIGVTPLLIFSILSYSRNLGAIENQWFLGQEVQILCFSFDILVLMIGMGLNYKNLQSEKERQRHLAILNESNLLKEKERISRDLHDHVGSQLSILSSGLENATFLANKKKLDGARIQNLNDNVKLAVQSLRDSIWATQTEEISVTDFANRLTSYLAKSIPDSIEWEITTVKETNQILSSVTALNAFRIIQEALQNILKHARSSKIQIVIKTEELNISFKVEDNGIGFDQLIKFEQMEHLGLFNMKNRVENLHGKFELSSQINLGTSVAFTLPFLEIMDDK